MDKCERRIRHQITDSQEIWMRCGGEATEMVTLRQPSQSSDLDLYFVVRVCSACVSSLTGWH